MLQTCCDTIDVAESSMAAHDGEFNIDDWEFSMVQCEDLGPMQEHKPGLNAPAPAVPHPVVVSSYTTVAPPPPGVPGCTADVWAKMVSMLQAYEGGQAQAPPRIPEGTIAPSSQVCTHNVVVCIV